MWRLAWSQLQFRSVRLVALLAGILLATTAFTVLTAASRTAQLRTVGTVSAHFVPVYDILVRPKGARTALENQTGYGPAGAPSSPANLTGTREAVYTVNWVIPVLIAAVDPLAEAKLDGLNRAVISGHYLTENAPGAGTSDIFPVLASSAPSTSSVVCRNVARARDAWLFTVPTEQFRAAAVSCSVRSIQYRSTITARCLGPSCCSAPISAERSWYSRAASAHATSTTESVSRSVTQRLRNQLRLR